MPIKLVDLSFNTITEFTRPEQALLRYKEAIGYIEYIKDRTKFSFVSHINYEGEIKVNGVKYSFFKRRRNFLYIPFKTNRYVKSLQPDIVLIEGLIFPLQVIALKLTLGRKCKIVAQFHNEKPFKGIKKLFQKIADACIDSYLFTSFGNAQEWVNEKIIRHMSKCHEVLEGSTYFTRQDKEASKTRARMHGDWNFLWVSRLNSNKDPLTVLTAFKSYVEINPDAKLYMVYQTEELLMAVKTFLAQHPLLISSVILQGKVEHDELPYWYSAADFYVSASHREGSGYALLEAMACGCIPIVTNIPSYRKITGEGQYGFLCATGNINELTNIFLSLHKISRTEFSDNVECYFKNNLSFENIADDLYAVCKKLTGK